MKVVTKVSIPHLYMALWKRTYIQENELIAGIQNYFTHFILFHVFYTLLFVTFFPMITCIFF